MKPSANDRRSPARKWLPLYIAIFMVFAGAKDYSTRYSLNPDAISYLDMAARMARGDWDPMVHPYWSPLYPLTLAAAFKIAGIHPESEFPLLHAVNWIIFAAMAAAFAYLLNVLWRVASAEQPAFERDRWLFPIWSGFCFALLWFYASQFLARGSPDALVACVAFLAAALAADVCFRAPRVSTAILLGAVLGMGYYAKAAMLPIGLLLLFCLIPAAWPLRRGLALLVVSALVLLAVAAPLVISLSRSQHRLTFGESGALNYAWSVNRVPQYSGWPNGNPSDGIPAHPPRVLIQTPRTLEFASPVPGTLPLWYNPVYWYQGANSHFNLRGEIRTLASLAPFFSDVFTYSLLPLIVIAVIAVLPRSNRPFASKFLFLVAWPVLVTGLYAMVVVEIRYVAPFLVLFLIGLLCMVEGSRRAFAAQKAVLLTAALLMAIPAAKDTLKSIAPALRSHASLDGMEHVEAARQLQAIGLHPGDAIGTIDTGFYLYCAHLAGLRITEAVFEPDLFWKLDDAKQAEVLTTMTRSGVKAVVAASPGKQCVESGLWRVLGNSGYVVYAAK